MTLALATIDNNDVYLMADTQITRPEYTGLKPYHQLKIFFLDKYTAIAYAGAAGEVAHARLMAIYEQGDLNDVFQLATTIGKSFDSQTDFLIAKAGQFPAIAKISDGRVASNVEGIYWIGDCDGANFVSKAAGSDHNDNKLPIAFQLQRQFESAIDDPCLISIGGHCVIAKGDSEGFNFIPYLKLVSPPNNLNSDFRQRINFGTSESGGFGYTVVVPAAKGVNGWGVFYFQGKFGKYFRVDMDQNIGEVLKAYADTVDEFIEIITKETGVSLMHGGSLN